jgi:hypothetical protein
MRLWESPRCRDAVQRQAGLKRAETEPLADAILDQFQVLGILDDVQRVGVD